MSKGHGSAQRFVLAQLEGRRNGQKIHDLARSWMHHKNACECEPAEFSRCECRPIPTELESIRRAVRTLERQGLVWTHWEVDSEDRPFKRVTLS
jgi:hypothetical protein